MSLESFLNTLHSRREVLELGGKAVVATVVGRTESGIHLATRFDPNIDPQGDFYNLPYWWPFDRKYAAQIGQQWIFADNGPLDAYDQATDELYGEGRSHIKELWRGYGENKLAQYPQFVHWIGGCAWKDNMVYHEKKPQDGPRYSEMQKSGVLSLVHSTDIPMFMQPNVYSFDYFLNEGKWFIANIPITKDSRWYHLIVRRVENQLMGSSDEEYGTGEKPFQVTKVVEAYRPYRFKIYDDVSKIPGQFTDSFYRNVAEFHVVNKQETLDPAVIDYMFAN